ncbi:unannotated protein [freshwater metagenome]|uniref:Unannotated protein n=1 Tax=freshwater metagenome TaxID=449393 RepID=A0A6J7J460_9ZZZZ
MDAGERALPTTTDRGEDRSRVGGLGELSVQHARTGHDQRAGGSGERLAQEVFAGHTWLPLLRDQRQSAGDEERVERVERRETSHGCNIARREDIEHQLGRPAVEGLVDGPKMLHHRQIASEQEQQHRLGGQHPVPDPLQLPGTAGHALEQPGDLVDHHDRRPAVRQRGSEQCQRGGQRRRRIPRRHCRSGQSRRCDGLSERGQLRRRVRSARGLEEQRRQSGARDELGDQPGLAHPASPAQRHRDAAVFPPPSLDVLQKPRQLVELPLPADECHPAPPTAKNTTLKNTIVY